MANIQKINNVNVHTYITDNLSTSDCVKNFSLDMYSMANQRNKNIKAFVIKIDANVPNLRLLYRNYDKYSSAGIIQEFKDTCIFNYNICKELTPLPNHPYNNFIDNQYILLLKYKKYLPENFKYINLETRKKVINKMFPNGINCIFSDCTGLLEDEYYGFNGTFDNRYFEETVSKNDLVTSFDEYKFTQLYILGYIIKDLSDKGIKDIYCVYEYSNLILYYEGINKNTLNKLVCTIIESFNKEFSVNIFLEGIGERNFKYMPIKNIFTKDVFGNKIGIGDLVLSPQCDNYSGSWVDPIIVLRINKDRIIPDVAHRQYYMANRCILLRSANGVIPKYGEKDFLV